MNTCKPPRDLNSSLLWYKPYVAIDLERQTRASCQVAICGMRAGACGTWLAALLTLERPGKANPNCLAG